ncbi:MAG: PIG-L deacetylase family protein [Hyphomicrobiaceae bacterium]
MLVIAPHPDDETIGCGGLIAFAAGHGIGVHVAVITNGSASHPGSCAWPPTRIGLRRRTELVMALATLGAPCDPILFDLPDAATLDLPDAIRDAARGALSKLLDTIKPDVVCTPWRRDPHCDHRFSYALTREAMRMVNSSAKCLEYMVWTNIIGTGSDQPGLEETMSLRLNIDPVRERKRAALRQHASQLGRLIHDDPKGFSLTDTQFESMTCGDERFEMDPLSLRRC